MFAHRAEAYSATADELKAQLVEAPQTDVHRILFPVIFQLNLSILTPNYE